MKLTVCIEMLLADLPFVERIAKVREAGYAGAEFWGFGGKNLPEIADACNQHGVEITSIAGLGMEPSLSDPAAHDACVARVGKAVEAAAAVGCRRVIVMSGNVIRGMTRERQRENIIDGLRKLAPVAEAGGATLIIEYLNSTHDHPGYFLDNFSDMAAIIRRVDHPNIKALLDIYHAGIMEGNMIEKIADTIDCIDHFHGAGIPGRHEMVAGEQNYPAICRAIDATGFDGWLGLEFRPLGDHMKALVETREWIEKG